MLGGLLTGAYLVLVLMHAMEEPDASAALPRPVATWREAVPLALALLAVLMGVAGLAPAGATAGAGLAMVQGVSP